LVIYININGIFKLDNIRIILIETISSYNIGAVARAMKTMGLQELYLVNPKKFPSEKSYALAVGAYDILKKVVIKKTVLESIKNCELIFGTSIRNRKYDWPTISSKKMAKKIIHYKNKSNRKIAILFGREDNGLSNHELKYCHYRVYIRTHSIYTSLNLSQAVQIISYDIYNYFIKKNRKSFSYKLKPLANKEVVQKFYEHLEKVLYKINFLKYNNKKKYILIYRFQRLFQKAKLETEEINLLRGFCSMIEKNIKNNNYDYK